MKKSSIICGKEEKVSILCGKKRKRIQFSASFSKKRVQFSASYSKKKVSILWVIQKKNNFLSHTTKSILWVIQKNHFFESKKIGPILWVIFFFKKCVIIQERSFKSGNHQNKSNSLNQVWKTKSSSLWVKSNSLSYFSKKEVQFFKSWFDSHFKKGSIRWVVLKKKGSILRVLKKAGSILRVMWKKSILSFQKKLKVSSVNFFNQKFQFFESHSKNGFDSLSRTQKKKVHFFESEKEKFNSYWEEVHERGSIQWVIHKEFNSLSHCWNKQKGFNSLSHFLGWNYFFKKIFEKFWTHTKKSSILWVQCKKGSTLSVKFKKVFNTLSHFLWKILLFESYWSKKIQFESCK